MPRAILLATVFSLSSPLLAEERTQRFDRDPGNQWLRSVINAEFGGGKSPVKRR